MGDVCGGLVPGMGQVMTSHAHQPSSDEADRDKETSPAGVARDLDELADELGASTGPSVRPTSDPDSPGATIDDPNPAEPNEPG